MSSVISVTLVLVPSASIFQRNAGMIIMLILSSVDMEARYCSGVRSFAETGMTAADMPSSSMTSISERILFFIKTPPNDLSVFLNKIITQQFPFRKKYLFSYDPIVSSTPLVQKRQ